MWSGYFSKLQKNKKCKKKYEFPPEIKTLINMRIIRYD